MPEFSGHLSLRAVARDPGRTVLAAQSFRAPFHLSKPYWDEESRVLMVQVVNPTAGILAGDRLELEIKAESGAALLVTTPSASRIFQMNGGSAECRQRFTVAADGWLEFLPEPLVPHRGSQYRQRTTIDVETGGSLFFVDQLQPGRLGHGEAWQWDRLCLELEVRLGGELILRERLDQTGDELRTLAEQAGSGPAACFVNAVLIAPQANAAPSWSGGVSALHRDGLWIGASSLGRGAWTLKMVAPDSVKLRAGLREVRRILAESYPQLAFDIRKL